MRRGRPWLIAVALIVAAAAVCRFGLDECALLRPDQRGHRAFVQGEFATAAGEFGDPSWRAVALYRDGRFEEAAGAFAGIDTAEAAFNQGNALVFLGRYAEAVERYSRALELRGGWEAAQSNRALAVARADLLHLEGGDMTGGKLGADEIQLTFGDAATSGEEVEVDAAAPSAAEQRAVWLRRLQTDPAKFLRAKFAYQHASREREGGR
jgi:Ca-activated chloride channel family protein